jgi:hypothetical protein
VVAAAAAVPSADVFAFAASAVVIDAAYDASSPSAAASSFNVSSAPGAPFDEVVDRGVIAA